MDHQTVANTEERIKQKRSGDAEKTVLVSTQSTVTCRACEGTFKNEADLRKHIDGFHFPMYKPFRQQCCGFLFGDRNLLKINQFCCNHYEGTKGAETTASIGQQRNEILEMCMESFVRYSIATPRGCEAEKQLKTYIESLLEECDHFLADLESSEIEEENSDVDIPSANLDDFSITSSAAFEIIMDKRNEENVAVSVDKEAENEGKEEKAQPAEVLVDKGEEKEEKPRPTKVRCKFCEGEPYIHLAEIEYHCYQIHELPGRLKCNPKGSTCDFVCVEKAEMKQHCRKNHKNKYKSKQIFTKDEKGIIHKLCDTCSQVSGHVEAEGLESVD